MSEHPLCIVAGVGPGVGFAVARRFSREGYRVALLARNSGHLEGFAGQLKREGGHAAAYPVDLRDQEALLSVLGRIQADWGEAAVLVYNAARWSQGPAMELPIDSFSADLALCVTGALVCAQAVYPAMRQRQAGTILFTGGGLALHPEYGAGVASLTAGKSALRGLTYALAKELAPSGIHVATVTIAGTVAPGTPFDPDRIAERYWALHRQPRDEWQTEEVFAGNR